MAHHLRNLLTASPSSAEDDGLSKSTEHGLEIKGTKDGRNTKGATDGGETKSKKGGEGTKTADKKSSPGGRFHPPSLDDTRMKQGQDEEEEPAEGPAAVAGLAKQHQQQQQCQHQHQQRGDCAPTAASFRTLGWRGVRSLLSSWGGGGRGIPLLLVVPPPLPPPLRGEATLSTGVTVRSAVVHK
ncbi:hypothetical protein PHYSODRAFT_347369 [Phytophthora sojae]|uniref:Uncharacterized protein n=1 Tax=Phytophthora sojae (strain P6497) TaxID=1094619 RepID=G4ZW35_PHYSP|nr:hypothetical protein PHYSODRAFT_347369 [Phytophthora sojae]EGZ12317.1 hypothetical protein PHYSODRAFT_347369 [Phytophthora sojae]|eukprot:XP_009532650.1 hypothetical protein PHYSODRAFT_347369 [Phytophthora sojae]